MLIIILKAELEVYNLELGWKNLGDFLTYRLPWKKKGSNDGSDRLLSDYYLRIS